MIDARSSTRLKGVHPDLVRVVLRAFEESPLPFVVTEGLRSLERQKELKRVGATTTMNSRHLTGHAVDLAPLVSGKVRWDWPLFDQLAAAMKKAAREEKVPVEWGGDWISFKDGPHFQLPWAQYPGEKKD